MPETESKWPAILSGCGCASLLISMALFAGAWWARTHDDAGPTPAESAHYENTREGRTGNLAESYVGFSFDYPKTWITKPDTDNVNFVAVERSVDSKTWENFTVGYFQTARSQAGNEAIYPQLISGLQNQFTQQFSGLRKVSEGKTKVGSYDAYQGLFHATITVNGQPVEVYTRAVLLPTPDGTKGVTLLLMGTSFHPELKEAEDLGAKGELPAVLESFRFAD